MEKLTVTSIRDDLNFDENGKLSTHYIAFPANRPDCPTSAIENGVKTYKGFEGKAVSGDALKHIFPHYGTGKSYLGREHHGSDIQLETGQEDNRCLAACIEKGTDIAVAGHTMPHFHYASSMEGEAKARQRDFNRWFSDTCIKVEVCLINYATTTPLEVFWVSEDGKRSKQFDLQYSERKTRCFHSYIGHTFEAIDEPTGFYQKIEIGHTSTIAFGTSPPSSSQRFDGIAEVERTVKHALDMEWRKHQTVERTFSSLGFAKGKLPKDVFANMAAFYYNNRHEAVNEEWEGKGVFVNWWETDVKFIAIPWDTKKKWQLRLMELVSAWAGVPVEETSMYGLRQYETGARLLSHVDRLPTHAVSLIVNIAQENLANPWPVEVFDHGDRLHEVTMDAGEIVYYESAKNLHSRNRPLTCKKGGCRFINLFTHYRPVNDGSNWYNNMEDMPNRPIPLKEGMIDFDTEDAACVFSNETSVDDHGINGDNVLGVGSVKCQDKRLGPYVSPTLFKAREADDLFRWWKATENAHLVGFDQNKEAVYHPAAEAFAEAYEPRVEHNPEPLTDAVAHDTHEQCMEWAGEGECEKNREFMMKNCRRSCNNAAIAESKTSRDKEEPQYGEDGDDTHESCDFWARQGECEKNPGWMWKNCLKSCREHGKRVGDDDGDDDEDDDDDHYDDEEFDDDEESGKDEL